MRYFSDRARRKFQTACPMLVYRPLPLAERRNLQLSMRLKLPVIPCERFDQWIAELNADSITLIFASAFLGNPASMFGHTFLRIDQEGQTEQTRLLAYTINYAADVPFRCGTVVSHQRHFRRVQGLLFNAALLSQGAGVSGHRESRHLGISLTGSRKRSCVGCSSTHGNWAAPISIIIFLRRTVPTTFSLSWNTRTRLFI